MPTEKFAKVHFNFWFGRASKKIRESGAETCLLALYLLTCPETHPLGIFLVDLKIASHRTGLSLAKLEVAFENLESAGFAFYKRETDEIWIPSVAENALVDVRPGDNRIAWLKKHLPAMEKSSYYGEFHARWGKLAEAPTRADLNTKKRTRKVSKSLRFRVLDRDGFRCRYCGNGTESGLRLEVEHVVPLNDGGSNRMENLVAACNDCNAGKGISRLSSSVPAGRIN